MAKVRKKFQKQKNRKEFGVVKIGSHATRSRKESLKKTEYSARRFADSECHKRRCTECRSRYFSRGRERNVLIS